MNYFTATGEKKKRKKVGKSLVLVKSVVEMSFSLVSSGFAHFLSSVTITNLMQLFSDCFYVWKF